MKRKTKISVAIAIAISSVSMPSTAFANDNPACSTEAGSYEHWFYQLFYC